DDEDNHVIAVAAHALGEVGAAARAAAPPLARRLGHVNPEVNAGAARALGRLGDASEEGLAALERAARDGSGPARGQAPLALVELGAPAARVRAAARQALRDADPEVRVAAVQALGRDRKAVDESSAAELLGALADANDRVKAEAARTLPDLVGATP